MRGSTTRYPATAIIVLGLLAIGVICVLTLPAAKGSNSEYNYHVEPSFNQVRKDFLDKEEHKGWLVVIAGMGAAMAAGAAMDRRSAGRIGQTWGVTIGVGMALALPTYLGIRFADLTSQAGDSSSSLGLGSGMILGSVCFVAAAVVQWLAPHVQILSSGIASADDARSVPSPLTPSVTDELERLSRLHRMGTLTDAEFQAAKERLIGF
jgi:hypothetical protein